MTTFNTGNPIGSTDSRDRLDNTENMDYLENSTTELTHPDRLGTVRKTRHGMEAEHDAQISAHESEHDAQISAHETKHDNQIAAHESEHDAQISAHETKHDNQIAAHESEHDAQMQAFESDFDGRLAGMAFTRIGSFTTGATLTDMRQVLVWEASQGGDGHEYGWTGSFLPSGKVVTAGTTPETSGGIGAGAWSDKTDLMLRDELAAQAGAGLIGFEQSGAGSAPRTAQDKMRERVTPQDFGAVGDGVTNDTAAFTKLEANYIGLEIDLLGKTYYVDSPFYGNKYYNGLWVGPFVTGTSRTRWQGAQMTGAGRIVFGDGALASLPENYSMGESATVVAVGYGAMGKMTKVKKAIAIGTNSQAEGTISRDNISIGEDSLRFVQSRTPDYDQAQQQGTRNIAIGGNAGRFIYEGIRDIAIGRNAGQCLVNSIGATIVGSNAVGGYAPIGFSGAIENWAPNNDPLGVTAFGAKALSRVITGFNIAVGNQSSTNIVLGRSNVTVGENALANAEVNSGFNGNQKTDVSIVGTYSHSGNTLTLNFVGHGAVVGGVVGVRLLDGASQTFQGDVAPAVVLSTTTGSLTVNHPVSRTATGSAQLYWTINTTPANKSEANCVLGSNALNAAEWANENVAVGHNSITNANDPAASVSRNVAVGFRALSGWISPINMTAIGHDALRFMQDGSVATGAGLNSTGVGRSSRVSGNNQVQLGDASTTTYVYGTVQNRSDERDKADIVETSLGIEFIMGLRAVDGRWDMRDDYFEEYEQQVGIDENAQPVFETRLRKIPKDGSKARKRKHHWFIAQEVKELCDSLGVEFGGYQDHSVNGGCDVLSLGYDEFIPPTVKAVQQCWTRLGELENRIAKLELK